jgi:hypothetical protein
VGVWGTLLLVDTAAVKSSFVIANVLITTPEPYTVVDMGDTKQRLSLSNTDQLQSSNEAKMLRIMMGLIFVFPLVTKDGA